MLIFQNSFLPGSYELQATREYPWTSITDTKIVTTGNEPKADVKFDLDGHRVDLSKELKGAEILFKGQKTGIKVGDPESASFGPINEEDEEEIQLLAAFSWGETTSSNYDKTRAPLFFEFKPDTKTAGDLYFQYAKEYGHASIKLSVEPFTTTTEKFNLAQTNKYKPSLFGHDMNVLMKTYYNKKSASIKIDKEGNPYMDLEGVVVYKRLATDYSRENIVSHGITIKALYDEDQKKWKVNECLDKSTFVPDLNEEGKYIITSAK